MLAWHDPLVRRPRRIAVAGVAGAGKSTACGRIAAMIGATHTEADGLFHGPGWTRRPTFVDDVAAVTAGDSWVMEWQGEAVRHQIAERCDLLVWLDHPFWRVTFPRVVRRTVRRRIRREILWNGNVEQGLSRIVVDRTHIIRWAIDTRHTVRELIPEAIREHPDLTVVRIRTPAEFERWLHGPLATATR